MAITGKDFFDLAKEKFQKGEIDILSDDIKVMGINATAVTGLVKATSEFLSEISTSDRTHAAGTGASAGIALTGKTVVGKVFDANNFNGSFPDPNNGNGNTDALVYFKWDGVGESTSPLLAFVVLSVGKPQDGIDDTLEFVTNVWEL